MISQIQHSSWPCKPYSQQTHLYSFILVVFVDLLVCEVYRYYVIWCSDAMCSVCFFVNNIIDRLFDFLDPGVSIVIIIVIITLDIIFILSSSLFMLVTSIIIVLLLRYQVPGVMDMISA